MKKKILIAVGIILIAIVVIIATVVISDFKQEENLKNELEEISKLVNFENINMDEINEKLDRTVTKGNYEIIEKAGKQYLSDSFQNSIEIAEILNDEKITKLLSAENYKTDGPEFTETQEYITETKNKLESCKTKYKDYLTEEKIMSYVTDKNLDSYYIDFYKNEIIGDLEEERKDNTVETSINELVNYLEKTEEIIKFLKENKDFWVIQNDNIIFSKDVFENKYNELISNLYESE